MSEIAIRVVEDVETMKRLERLQMEIWGMPEYDVVPAHQMLAAAGAGGSVIGAFDRDGALVGFCYGFAGWREGRPLFHSHMAGVVGGRQLQEVGFRLKCAQRDAAIAMGFDHAVWTYDPLQSINARFNMRKLGTTARRYYVNYYGEMPDEINRGIDSDRLEVDWALCSRRVQAAVSGMPDEHSTAGAGRALEAVPGNDRPSPHAVAPADPALGLEAPVVLIEVPTEFTAIRAHDMGLARAWRAASREAFLHYFERGYHAVDFLFRAGDRQKGEYVLVGPGEQQRVEEPCE